MNAAPVGVLTIRRDSLPLTVKLELDQAAAAALGWPGHVEAELAGRGLAVAVRVSLPGRALGRWAAYAEAGRLVADLAGPDLGRKAA